LPEDIRNHHLRLGCRHPKFSCCKLKIQDNLTKHCLGEAFYNATEERVATTTRHEIKALIALSSGWEMDCNKISSGRMARCGAADVLKGMNAATVMS
jgi:hypothetical protein